MTRRPIGKKIARICTGGSTTCGFLNFGATTCLFVTVAIMRYETSRPSEPFPP